MVAGGQPTGVLPAGDAQHRHRPVAGRCPATPGNAALPRQREHRPPVLRPHDAVELRPALFGALDTPTTQQRAIVVLRYFDDRSEAEVAKLLGVSAGTVKSTASRAMAQLRVHPGLTAIFATTDSPA
ncbi:MAG: sigma-70 family RNA polymerase sigma factor [Streptosporangiaceae bacterium]